MTELSTIPATSSRDAPHVTRLVACPAAPFSFFEFQALDAEAPRDLGGDSEVFSASEYPLMVHHFGCSVDADGAWLPRV